MGWEKIGEGSYNVAYRSDDGKSVLKIPKKGIGCDEPVRAARVWNELNPTLKPAAYLTTDKTLGTGWVCPFIEGEQASDEDIAKALVSIFNASGRIVMDAFCKKNFIKTPSGHIACVDIGMALLLNNPYVHPRRYSLASLINWQHLKDEYKKEWDKHEKSFPLAITMIKALVFIKSYRADILDVSFLSANQPLIELLAKALSEKSAFSEALDALRLATLTQVVIKPGEPGKRGLGVPGGLVPTMASAPRAGAIIPGATGGIFAHFASRGGLHASDSMKGLAPAGAGVGIAVKPTPFDVFFKPAPAPLDAYAGILGGSAISVRY
jgi:hypothetical protein